MGKYNNSMSLIRGFWESSDDFNDESGLTIFSIYIGEIKNDIYPIYILMVDSDEKILINTPAELKLKKIKFNNDYIEFNANICNLQSDFLPNFVNFKFYPRSGKILMTDNETVLGCLFKNPVLTEMDLIKDNCKIITEPFNENEDDDDENVDDESYDIE